MMTGAMPSTVPFGVLIYTFCQPLKDILSSMGIFIYFGLLGGLYQDQDLTWFKYAVRLDSENINA